MSLGRRLGGGFTASGGRLRKTIAPRQPIAPQTEPTSAATLTPDGKIHLSIPRLLKSPNHTYGAHWRHKNADRQSWEKHITDALMIAEPKVRSLAQVFGHLPVRVTIERQVARSQGLIRDDDNLRFATKPLNDALKRVGLIKDDSREWIDQAMPVQIVSGDRLARTIITLEQITHTSAPPKLCRVHQQPIVEDMNGVPHCFLCRKGAAADVLHRLRHPNLGSGEDAE